MAQAAKDQNRVSTLLATSNADGSTPLRMQANPTSHALDVSDGTTGSDLSGDIAARDENHVPVFMAVSSVDGVTPVAVYIDSVTKELLVDSS